MKIDIVCDICFEVSHKTSECLDYWRWEEMKNCNHERIQISYIQPENVTPFYECVDCMWWQIG